MTQVSTDPRRIYAQSQHKQLITLYATRKAGKERSKIRGGKKRETVEAPPSKGR